MISQTELFLQHTHNSVLPSPSAEFSRLTGRIGRHLETITKNMTISQVVRLYPGLTHVLEEYGMGCSYCMASLDETIEGGARMHGVSLERLLSDLNQALAHDRKGS